MDNAQTLNADENIRKGAHTVESVLTRSWQLKFLENTVVTQILIFTCCPACRGKNNSCLGCGARISKYTRRRLIIVSPTLNIRSQWKDVAQKSLGYSF